MKDQLTTSTSVPFGQKLAFALGMFANQMFPAILGIFIVVLVEDIGFPGWMLGVLYFFPRVFDSITDPIMGFISDNTRSKWGRRKQYVIVGAIIMGISFSLMWQLYTTDSISYNFTYFLLWSFVFYLGLTIFSVPYVAMGYEMSDDFHERTSIMAMAQFVGQFAWVIAPWFWVIMYDPDMFATGEEATRTLAVWVGVVCALFAMIPGFFIKSRSTLQENYADLTLKNISSSFNEIKAGFTQALTIKPFRKLCIATFLIFNAFNTVAGFSFFIIKFFLFDGNQEKMGLWATLFGSVGAIITTLLVIPIVAAMSRKLGKKKAFLYSQGISIIGYILLYVLFVPGKPYLFLFALPFFSFGIGSLFTLMMSMTSDVIDIDELNTGKRREGIFGAIYWWMVKFGLAIAGGLSGLILTLVGYVSNAETQTPEAMEGLRYFFSGLPIIGTLLAMYVMKDYSVSEEKAAEIRASLDAKKNPPNPYANQIKSFDYTIEVKDPLGLNFMSYALKQKEFKSSLTKDLTGLCFSPYREGQEVNSPLSVGQVEERMDIVQPYVQWIRTFSCLNGNEFSPVVAKNKGLKTMVGAWISDDLEANQNEINSLITLGKNGSVDIAVIGNEVLLREELEVQQIIDYLKQVKTALPDIRIGYVDGYYKYIEYPDLIDIVDVVLINCYPFWEGCAMSHAVHYMNEMYEAVQAIAKGKEIVIAETGWPSQGDAQGDALPSEENAMTYFIQATNWSTQHQVPMMYFSSFDESWKIHKEGDVGARWGLWDTQENLKY